MSLALTSPILYFLSYYTELWLIFFFIAQNEMAVFISKLKFQIFRIPQLLALLLPVQSDRLWRGLLRTRV